MKVKATYLGNNEALVAARYGVGEHVLKTHFILVDDKLAKGEKSKINEPKVNDEIEIDLNANERDDLALTQEAAYKMAQDKQDEVPPPELPFVETENVPGKRRKDS